MDTVRPPLRAGQKNDHVIYSALQVSFACMVF